jgi:secondary thiamine-phosphate synthase enzyme
VNELIVQTNAHTEFVEITDRVQRVVDESGVKNGVCICFVPHTTAGITINENADPDVVSDMIYALEKAVPWKDSHYQHGEGNTAAHVKSSMMGHSSHILVRNGIAIRHMAGDLLLRVRRPTHPQGVGIGDCVISWRSFRL